MTTLERDSMQYDVVIVGAGPAGLSAAIRLKQLAAAAGREVSVCVVEKGSEVGANILSGAVIDPVSLSELLPDWQQNGAPPGKAASYKTPVGAMPAAVPATPAAPGATMAGCSRTPSILLPSRSCSAACCRSGFLPS